MGNLGIYYQIRPGNMVGIPEGDGTLTTIRLTDYNILKVPDYLYQDFFSIAQNFDKEYAGKAVLKKLNDWVAEKWPDMELNAFIDLSAADVGTLTSRGITGFSWGMYIQLRSKDETVPLQLINTLQNLLNNETKETAT